MSLTLATKPFPAFQEIEIDSSHNTKWTDSSGTRMVSPALLHALFDGSKFIVASAAPYTFFETSSGAWTQVKVNASGGLVSGKGVLVAASSSVIRISQSADGTLWIAPVDAFSAIGDSYRAGGMTFTDNILGLAYNNGVYLAVAASGRIITATNPGAPWKQVAVPALPGGYFTGVAAFGTEGFIVFGESANLQVSHDLGKTWKQSPILMNPASAKVNAIASNGNTLVVVGQSAEGSEIARSGDGGITWTNVIASSVPLSLRGGSLSAVTFTGSEFIAVGPQGMLMTSSDGIAWAVYTGLFPTEDFPNAIAYANAGPLAGTLLIATLFGRVLVAKVSS